MLQWEQSAGEANVAAVAAGGTEGADDYREDEANVAAVEANVAAVAAEGTEGADGERSDVSSEVFCPQIERRDPVAEADLMDYEEFVAEHGACAIAEIQQLAASTQGAAEPADREMNDAVAADYFGPEFWRGWDEAEAAARRMNDAVASDLQELEAFITHDGGTAAEPDNKSWMRSRAERLTILV